MRETRSTDGSGNHRWPIVILSIIVVLLASAAAECRPQMPTGIEKPFILFLDSYHTNYPWSINVRSGVRERLQAEIPATRLAIEYMDTKHHATETLFPILADLFERKYGTHPPAVIIASDNNALNFVATYRRRIFPDVPVVFCGINDFKESMLAGQTHITGVVEAASFRQTIALALDLHPEASAIYSIAGSALTTRIHIRELADAATDFKDRVEFLEIHERSLSEFAVALETIPSTGIILWLGLYRDTTGAVLSLKEAFTFIRAHTDRPIYTMWSQNLPYCVSGVMISGQEQGRQAAAMAARILAGESATDIPIVRESPNVPMFNYVELGRLHIPMDALPPDADIINQPPPSFYFQNRQYIWAALGVIAVLSVLVAALTTLNVLSFARKSDGTADAHDLADLMDQTIDLASTDYDLKKQFDFRHIRVIRDYDLHLSRVPCEAAKIQQVLLNILRNGAEAMQMKWRTIQKPKNGEGPRFIIRLEDEPENDRVRIEIADNGPGMDEKCRNRVFEPFFTTKPTNQGTGLGLSVSYFIVTENHGGQMMVESIPDVGTTFIIHLPLHRQTAP